MSSAPSEPASEAVPSDAAESEIGGGSAAPSYPPYPPFTARSAPPSVAETIVAGRGLRVQHKSMPPQPVHPLPRPSRPRGPKATDVKMNRRATRQHARCLRRHGAVLTDRLERMAKPPRRRIIYLWREQADRLPAETIARLRALLDADEPFKPDQAYEYFINMRKTKKAAKKQRAVNQIKKDVQAVCADKRFAWARNATVAFARGVQQRLARGGRCYLADGMLKLSDIILDEFCGFMKMRTPSRRSSNPKAKFMMEMSDKVAIWIDGVLSESDDRMLMMDFDEDEDLFATDKFTDDFLDMMGGGGGGGPLSQTEPAYHKFTGEMLEVFIILTDSMKAKGTERLLSHGKFTQTYAEAANELKTAENFEATQFDTTLANQLNKDLNDTVKSKTSPKLAPHMKDMVDICANYLSQYAEFSKGKGPAFKALVKAMKGKGDDSLYQKEQAMRTYAAAATELEKAKGLETDHDDTNLTKDIHGNLSKLMETATSPDLKTDMAATLDICSKYLSQNAIDKAVLDPKELQAWEENERNRMRSGGAQSGMGRDGAQTGMGRDGGQSQSGSGRNGAQSGLESDEAQSGMGRQGGQSQSGKGSDGSQSGTAHDGGQLGLGRGGGQSQTGMGRDGAQSGMGRDGAQSGTGRGGGQSQSGMGPDGSQSGMGTGNRFDGSKSGLDGRTQKGGRGMRESDLEYEQALGILHKQLQARGGETLYSQPRTTLTHAQASKWIAMKPPMHVEKTVKESGDTARLHQMLERKLGGLVSGVTPEHMRDCMQDVVIESSRILSEYFVSANYKALVKDALISEMQKRGNEIIVDDRGATETSFFAAQRLKKAKSLEIDKPTRLCYGLRKKMEEIIRCRSMGRKLTATMKDHIKESADYLSGIVTTPDEQIEAYVALLNEMDELDGTLLIEGSIPKSYKDSAAYLRSLTTCEDQINMANSALRGTIETSLNNLMSNVPPRGYTNSVMKSVIGDSARLLVSYVMLQVERTEALNCIVEQLGAEPDGLLLRHGTMRRANADGADLLRGRNTDQLAVATADPVVSRKIQIKLTKLMENSTPQKYAKIMEDVIFDVTLYLAVELLKPPVIKVCKCMKNVFVQCELWCDEILRRVARPCCACTRHASAQALPGAAPADSCTTPGAAAARAPAVNVSLRPCPARSHSSTHADSAAACPAPAPAAGCDPTAYMLYSTQYARQRQYVVGPTRLPRAPPHSSLCLASPSPRRSTGSLTASSGSSPVSYVTCGTSETNSDQSPGADSPDGTRCPITMHAQICPEAELSAMPVESEGGGQSRLYISTKDTCSMHMPVVATDQMADWHSMMVSLTWNVQAWRNWIQETIDRAIMHHHNTQSGAETEQCWTTFRRRITTEALQWRQYNLFSRQLTLRLALRYKDKKIVSPTRATVKTPIYIECQKEMLEIINMFNRWTHWLYVIVKETDSLQETPDSEASVNDMRWSHFKSKVEEYAEDWLKYNMHLKICNQYMSLIKDWLPAWNEQGPVWVLSACGAVPSGAVRAGAAAGEATWVARTTHRGRVLPAALRPSLHCCLLYADGAVHRYTKYQVMCNARARWVAWRAGAGAGGAGARAVRVSAGVLAGRVLLRGSHLLGAVRAPAYRCHVVIFGRPFAFDCYELLVLADD